MLARSQNPAQPLFDQLHPLLFGRWRTVGCQCWAHRKGRPHARVDLLYYLVSWLVFPWINSKKLRKNCPKLLVILLYHDSYTLFYIIFRTLLALLKFQKKQVLRLCFRDRIGQLPQLCARTKTTVLRGQTYCHIHAHEHIHKHPDSVSIAVPLRRGKGWPSISVSITIDSLPSYLPGTEVIAISLDLTLPAHTQEILMRSARRLRVISIKVAALTRYRETDLNHVRQRLHRCADSRCYYASPFLFWNFETIERRCQQMMLQIHPDHAPGSNHPGEDLDCPS